MEPVKLSDVARRAGVSAATVSRVLTASRPVTPAIEQSVRKAAAELGYTGNSIARALRRRRTDTIGMVVPSILNPFFTTLVDSMEQALHAEGKQLLLCDSRQDPAVEADHLKSLLERHVDGIVVSPCDETLSRTALATSARAVPLVQLDRKAEVEAMDWVGLDDDHAMRLLLGHVAEQGARSAAFVGSDLANSSNQDRLAGFRRHADRAGVETRQEWVALGEYSIASGTRAGHALLSLAEHPDAVVCADDLIAFGVLRACRELGVSVPQNVMVTGYDNLDFDELTTPSLTSIEQPTRLMAEETLRLLARRTDEPDYVPGARVALVPRLVVRESTSRVPTAPGAAADD